MSAPYWQDDHLTIHGGDCREVMAAMPERSVHCVVTSPPYWGLRDYGTATWVGGDEECDHRVVTTGDKKRRDAGRSQTGTFNGSSRVTELDAPQFAQTCGKCGAIRQDGQLGLEATPDAYVEAMVGVFREVRRVLRDDGTVWLNLGDSYASGEVGRHDRSNGYEGEYQRATTQGDRKQARLATGLAQKQLVGIPWRVAFALQADGWYLRSDIIWSKPNPMPESVTDRPTKAHEYLFLLSKSPRYYYDADAVREASETRPQRRLTSSADLPGALGRAAAGGHSPMSMGGSPTKADKQRATTEHGIGNGHHVAGFNDRWDASEADGTVPLGRNLRSVWTIATEPYPGAHFATFPRKLVEPCIKAGSPEGGLVLDPFAGSGTTLLVAQALGRRAVGIDLNPDYLRQCLARNAQTPLGLGA